MSEKLETIKEIKKKEFIELHKKSKEDKFSLKKTNIRFIFSQIKRLNL